MEQIKPILIVRVNQNGLTEEKRDSIEKNWSNKTGNQYHVICLSDLYLEKVEIEVHSVIYKWNIEQEK